MENSLRTARRSIRRHYCRLATTTPPLLLLLLIHEWRKQEKNERPSNIEPWLMISLSRWMNSKNARQKFLAPLRQQPERRTKKNFVQTKWETLEQTRAENLHKYSCSWRSLVCEESEFVQMRKRMNIWFNFYRNNLCFQVIRLPEIFRMVEMCLLYYIHITHARVHTLSSQWAMSIERGVSVCWNVNEIVAKCDTYRWRRCFWWTLEFQWMR